MHKKAMHNVTSNSEKILIRRAIFKTSLAINGKNQDFIVFITADSKLSESEMDKLISLRDDIRDGKINLGAFKEEGDYFYNDNGEEVAMLAEKIELNRVGTTIIEISMLPEKF